MKTDTRCVVFMQTTEVWALGELTLFTIGFFDEILMKKDPRSTSGRKSRAGWGANVSC